MPEVQNEILSDKAADKAVDKAAEKGRDAQRAVGARAAETVESERRNFEEAARQGADAAQSGLNAARDMAKRGAETTRQIAESGRRTTFEIADFWRDAMEPVLKSQVEMTRWLDQLWRHTTGVGALPALSGRPFAGLSPASLLGLPPADFKETDQSYEVCLELPGLDRQDLDLKVRGDLLTISASKVEDRAEAASAYRISERRFGRMERSFPLPADVRREAIQASYVDGLLKVTMPRTSEAAPAQQIEVR